MNAETEAKQADGAELLGPATNEVAIYSQTEAALAEMRQQLAGKTWNLRTVAGNREARQTRAALVSLRTDLDKRRKELKRPLLDHIARIDERAKEITAQIVEMETPIDTLIREDEARREAERQEAERREAERLQMINARIDEIARLPGTQLEATADELQVLIDTLTGTELDFDPPHLQRAMEARELAVTQLRTLQRNAQIRAEQAAQLEERLAAERASAERERAARRVQEAIDGIAGIVTRAHLRNAAGLREVIASTEAIDVLDARYGDRTGEAREAREKALDTLRIMLADAEQKEADAAELEKLRAERAERERQDREAAEQRAAQERAEAEAAEAERQRLIELGQEAAEAERIALEQDEIATCTLENATAEALEMLTSLGHGQHLVARKLAAARFRAGWEN